MKLFNEWLRNLDEQEINWLVAIFLSAFLGSGLSGLVLKIGMMNIGEQDVGLHLLVSLGATAVYAATVILVFSLFIPETVPALKKLIKRD